MAEFVEVALPIAGGGVFHYAVPEELAPGAAVGKRALVPFKNRKALGFIVDVDTPPPEGVALKDVIDVVDEKPLFDEKRLRFFRWVADYYFASLGSVLKTAHPGGLGISLKKTLAVTPAGETAVAENRLRGIDERVLRTLSHAGAVPQAKLLGLLDGLKHETLNSLIKRRFIEAAYELHSDPKIKREKIVHVSGEAELLLEGRRGRRLGETKRQIIQYLLEHRKAPYEELKGLFGPLSQHLSWLKKRGVVEVEEREVYRDPYGGIEVDNEPAAPELNPDQRRAYEAISHSLREGGYGAYLLHGVTGSGKTEVYMRVVADALSLGKEALVLVPEISLTPQLVKRFRSRFGRDVAVIHSALSDGERFDAWRMASGGEIKIVIGARSAIFAPFKNLGVVVVDEEHEPSYKQEESPHYNARDLALVRGSQEGLTVVLGSATPSAESYANVQRGKMKRLSLPLRVLNRPLPEVVTVDMKREKSQILSKPLRSAIVKNFELCRQTILFLNKRGFSSLLLREEDGEIMMCPNCTIPLTYHINDDSVICHFCGTKERFGAVSTKFGEGLRKVGVGTEKVEETVKRLLPDAVVARMDSDTVRGKRQLLNLYQKLERGEIDVLVGTQMVAKGHDLPGVTLVGVISADMALGIPDFRSSERTFQLLTQVAGRSGRGGEKGRVFIQTYNPGHPSIRHAMRQDSIAFLESELGLREELQYPPFTRLVSFGLKGRDERKTREAAEALGKSARAGLAKFPPGSVTVTGPSPAPIYRIRNKFRWQMIARSGDVGLLHKYTSRVLVLARTMKLTHDPALSVNIDPTNFG